MSPPRSWRTPPERQKGDAPLRVESMPRSFGRRARRYLAAAQQGLCAWCGQPFDDSAEGDHVMRWTNGGPTDSWNGQLLHPKCHREKERSHEQ